MDGTESILRLVDAYSAAEGVPDSTASYRVFSDSKRVRLLREGGGITFRRYARAVQWLSDNWPGEAKWPVGIKRPARVPKAGEAA